MSTPRADDVVNDPAYQEKVRIIQAIYGRLKRYAERLAAKGKHVNDQHETVGRGAKLAAINELILTIAIAIDPNNKKEYEDNQELYKDEELKKIIDDLPKKLPSVHVTIGSFEGSVKDEYKLDPLDKLLKTDLPDLLINKKVEQRLQKRRKTHAKNADNAIRSFFDKLSLGLFAKVKGREVVKKIKAQLKLFDQQVTEREKAEEKATKAEKAEQRKAEAKKEKELKKESKKAKADAKEFEEGYEKKRKRKTPNFNA